MSSQNDRYLDVVNGLVQAASQYKGPALEFAVAMILEKNADLSRDIIFSLFRQYFRNTLPSQRGQLNKVLMIFENL